MAKKKAETLAKELKKTMLDNLQARGLVDPVYVDKVTEYIDLWMRRQALKEDIEERGVTVLDEKRGVMTENRSVSLEVQVSRQMLAIYGALGFKASSEKDAGADLDDDL